MRVTLRKTPRGELSAYVAKKDLEEIVVASDHPGLWGGVITLANGWRLALPVMAVDTPMPVTVEARRLGD